MCSFMNKLREGKQAFELRISSNLMGKERGCSENYTVREGLEDCALQLRLNKKPQLNR